MYTEIPRKFSGRFYGTGKGRHTVKQLGKYGATVKPFNPEVQKKCIGDEKPITCRPADLLDNELEKLESEMAQYKEQDEDVLTYALFPQVAMDFFKYRQAQKTKVDEKAADKKNGAYPV